VGSFPARGQDYPPLTKVISFDSLWSIRQSRKLEWTNPDGSADELEIVEMPVPADERMKALIREFELGAYGRDSIWVRPRVLVFHAMGDGDLRTSLEVSSFLNDQMPATWGPGRLPNGAHFIVDRDGTVYALTPPTSYDRDHHGWLIRRHQDANPVAIGIENVTDRGNLEALTSAQITANGRLGRWLQWMEHGRIRYATSHHQFNDDRDYAIFLRAFGLKCLSMRSRTRGRRDIGDRSLELILDQLNSHGMTFRRFFIFDK
jgi:hypothetical protein